MRVFIAPLNWGLGHATRCIPIVRALRAAGHEVVLGADGPGRLLLHSEFPDVPMETLASYSMRYSKSRFWLPLWLLLQLPFFFASMLRDWLRLPALVRRHGVGLVIADGRYGLRTRRVPCVFVTHQLDIEPPGPVWLRPWGRRALGALNRLALRGFREIWVPDFPGSRNLAGRLSHPGKSWPRAQYIYPLCRYRPEDLEWRRAPPASASDGLEVLAWASGPEPQRSVFEALLRRQLESWPGTRVLVRGLPGGTASSAAALRAGELNVFDHLPGPVLQRLLESAHHVVCRSGYTSVMELAGLGKNGVLLVPTPGQSEQEYLAQHLQNLGAAATQSQEHVDLAAGWHRAATLPGFGLFLRGDGQEPDWNLAGWLRRHPRFL